MPQRLSQSLTAISVLCVPLFVPSLVHASVIVENGDAGSLPATAQITLGTDQSSLTLITGTLSSTSDRDMYRIYLDGSGTFSATTNGQPGTIVDTQLFLFDANGLGVYANDDDASGVGINGFRSTLPAGNPLTPRGTGYYYLLIDASSAFPTSAGGVIFPNFTTNANATAVVGPTGPGGALPITGYTGTGAETGTYTIALTGARAIAPAAVTPEPGSVTLLVGLESVRHFGEQTSRTGTYVYSQALFQ